MKNIIHPFFLIVLFLLHSCSSSESVGYRIGVDPTWYPNEFGSSQTEVTAFSEELLLDISTMEGVPFEKMRANWDSLLMKLDEREYDGVLCSLHPYNFNLAKYDFSDIYLPTGDILVVGKNSKAKTLSDLKGKRVALISTEPSVMIVEKYPEVMVSNYASIEEALASVANGTQQGALIDFVMATDYVDNLYSDQLKIVGDLLDQRGLRLVTLKGENERLMRDFNKGLRRLKRKSDYTKLKRKWDLDL